MYVKNAILSLYSSYSLTWHLSVFEASELQSRLIEEVLI